MKDLSYEAPKTPLVFKENWKPDVNLEMNNASSEVESGIYEVVLKATVTVKNGENVAFIAEVAQAGLFLLQGVEGIQKEAILKGVLAGFPTVDFTAALVFGSYHDVDSSEMAFKIAASMAFKKGIVEASPILLEPIMSAEVVVPEEYLGDVMGDFNSRRGRIMGIDSRGRLQVVKAQVPLAEMFRYAIILRSMTSGRGSFTMSYSHYEEVPGEIAKKVIAAHKVEEEEEN